MNLKNHAEAFLGSCRSRYLSERTVKSYEINLKQFVSFLDERGSEITEETVSDYIVWIRSKYKETSVNQKISTLSTFLSYLTENQIIPENMVKTLEVHQKKQKPVFQTVSAEEIAAVLACAYKEKETIAPGSYAYMAILRDIAILEILTCTCIRVSELCLLKRSDVDLDAKAIHVTGLGKKERVLKFGSEKMLQALLAYEKGFLKRAPKTQWYFVNKVNQGYNAQSVRNMLKRYGELAHLNIEFTPKVLRDSVITFLVEDGIDLVSLQNLLGHKNVAQTLTYFRDSDEHEGSACLRDRMNTSVEGAE